MPAKWCRARTTQLSISCSALWTDDRSVSGEMLIRQTGRFPTAPPVDTFKEKIKINWSDETSTHLINKILEIVLFILLDSSDFFQIYSRGLSKFYQDLLQILSDFLFAIKIFSFTPQTDSGGDALYYSGLHGGLRVVEVFLFQLANYMSGQKCFGMNKSAKIVQTTSVLLMFSHFALHNNLA